MENKPNVMGFFVACRNSDIRTAKDLLKHVDPSSLKTIWEGRTCFHVAVIAGDPDLFRELVATLPVQDFRNTIKKADKKGDTALHLAVRKNRVDLVKQLVGLDANLCDFVNKERETPLKLAASLGFKEAIEFLITRTTNALHYIVELNQVKLVQFLIERNVELSELINQPYKPSDGGDEGLTKASGDGGDNPSAQSAGWNKSMADEKGTTESTKGTNTQNDQPIVLPGDTPLHIAARNKSEHMVNLLLKVAGVDNRALNIEYQTPFDVAREVTEYHESFDIIRMLWDFGPKRFMYCAPQVSHKKLMEARRVVKKSYEERRNADQIVAVLLATMTFTAAFTVPGGFQTDTKQKDELGSAVLISFTSFKLFLILDCVAFFLALFICIMRQMIPEHATGDNVLFMTIINSLFYCTISFTAFGFMAAVYTILGRKMVTFSWVILGIVISTIYFCPLVHFAVTRARFHRLCGVSSVFDDLVVCVWSGAERCGLLDIYHSGGDVSQDLITGHVACCGLMKLLRSKNDNNSRPTTEHEVSHNNSLLTYQVNSRSSSPFRTRGSVQV